MNSIIEFFLIDSYTPQLGLMKQELVQGIGIFLIAVFGSLLSLNSLKNTESYKNWLFTALLGSAIGFVSNNYQLIFLASFVFGIPKLITSPIKWIHKGPSFRSVLMWGFLCTYTWNCRIESESTIAIFGALLLSLPISLNRILGGTISALATLIGTFSLLTIATSSGMFKNSSYSLSLILLMQLGIFFFIIKKEVKRSCGTEYITMEELELLSSRKIKLMEYSIYFTIFLCIIVSALKGSIVSTVLYTLMFLIGILFQWKKAPKMNRSFYLQKMRRL